jgi:hypothetical protein
MTGISRRQFLKLGVAATGAAALAVRPGRARASTGPDPARVPAMLIDISRCVGCEACHALLRGKRPRAFGSRAESTRTAGVHDACAL